MALQLSNKQAAIVNALETPFDTALATGTENPPATPIIIPLPGYTNASFTTLIKNQLKCSFKAVVAAFISLLEDWTEIGSGGAPAFQNSWVNFDITTYNSAAFFRDPFGVVHLKGLVSGGTVGGGDAIFTLPSGYRPTKVTIFAVSSNGAFGDLRIDGNGLVYLNTGSNAYASLDGISFRIA